MQKLRVIGVFGRINSGKVKLTDEQASARMHNLQKVKKGIYEIVNPIGFKHDEEFGYDGPKLNRKQFAPFEEVVSEKKDQKPDIKSVKDALRLDMETVAASAKEAHDDLTEEQRRSVTEVFDLAEKALAGNDIEEIKAAHYIITELCDWNDPDNEG